MWTDLRPRFDALWSTSAGVREEWPYRGVLPACYLIPAWWPTSQRDLNGDVHSRTEQF